MAAGASSASGGGLGGSVGASGADGGEALSNGGQSRDGNGYGDAGGIDANALSEQLQQLAQGQDSLRSFLTEHPLLGNSESGDSFDGFDEFGDGLDGELPGDLDPEALAGLEEGVGYTVGEDGQLTPNTGELVQQQVQETLAREMQPVHDAMANIVGRQMAQESLAAATHVTSEFPELASREVHNEVLPIAMQWAQELGIPADGTDPRFFSHIVRTAYMNFAFVRAAHEEAAMEGTPVAHVEGGAAGGGGQQQQQQPGYLQQLAGAKAEYGLGSDVLPFK